MKHVNKKLLLSAAIAAMLAGCDSGGISIEPETVDNSVSGGTPTDENNPCASYEESGQVMQGSFDGTNCTYSASFVDSGNALTQDLFIPALDNGGVHIFEGSLFVGNNYDDDATMAAAGIAEGGDGAKLTIEAGSTIAFPDSTKFMVVNRGSQVFAVGTADAPITFTSTSDAVDNAVAFDAVQQWGGMVINGFGITNKCSYDASLNTSECHVLAEGAAGKDQSNYGGDNNSDSSGQLEYVRVKHTGAEVANGDELNGITFSAVGGGTIIKNLEVYSTYDDGIEMFGGAVSFENYLAMYVRDDSIDIDEGWNGSITNALVIQSETDGNHCIESDGIGSYDDKDSATIDAMIAAGINSRPVIDGLTCIISANGADTATHDPGAGWRFREAIFPKITNSMVVASFNADTTGADGSNYCLRVEDPETLAEAETGTELQIESNIFACEDRTKGGPVGAQTLEEWAVANNNIFADITGAVDPTAMNATQLQILEGTPSVFSIAAGNMMVNDAPISISPISRAYFGALSQGDLDWTQGWTYGLHDGEPLWFAN
ncbi:serine/threonine protein kinase [Microbulbifer sediminum]|uniref:serine/threonine protein kinase n=1 Tax=Microbulbifer sediminum TaxID=2904250 RepID=UPI001F1B94D8|nr:serine/threonine protein kinase [Microbulbifer sediminum]